MTTDKTKWAYLAAIFDGEGCFHVAKQKTPYGGYSYRLDMPIGMSSLVIMKWLVQNFGGTYQKGKLDLRYKKPKQMYYWKTTDGKEAGKKERMLLGMLPYLVEKHEQALEALAFLRLPWGAIEEKERAYWLLRRLKWESVETNTSDSDASEKIEPELNRKVESDPAVMPVSQTHCN